MLKNAYLDAKIGVDPAENEPSKVSAPNLSVLRQYTESGGEAPGRDALGGLAADEGEEHSFTLSEAPSRLDQRRFSRPNTQFFSIFQNLQENHLLASKFGKFLLKNCKFLQIF